MKLAGSHPFDNPSAPSSISTRAESPIVFAVRVRGRYGDLLELVCPLCEKQHIHGAGEHGSPCGSGDGHRLAHCIDPRKRAAGYIVIERRASEAAA